MIEAKNLSKNFDDIKALDDINATIKEGNVFGLIGTNGAGKSTFLKLVSGVLRPDKGEILVDEEKVYENIKAKEKFFYISDDQYFFPNSRPLDMMIFYKTIYPKFDEALFKKLLSSFELDLKRKINTFSKGMKKQLSIILGLSANTKYILCDETFDGLDPVMRQAVKSLFAQSIEDRGLTPIIASHNLRELEDICDHIGLLHKGGILLSKDISELKVNIHKVQCVFNSPIDISSMSDLDIIQSRMIGSIHTLTIRGTEEYIRNKIVAYEPIFYEMIPLSLEEIFISETEVKGYDIKKLIF